MKKHLNFNVKKVQTLTYSLTHLTTYSLTHSLTEERVRLQELEDMNTAPVLTVNNFKHLWGTLETSGSFSCKLKSTPTHSLLRNHLEKNGFYVVFVTENGGSRDIELGLCNIRCALT